MLDVEALAANCRMAKITIMLYDIRENPSKLNKILHKYVAFNTFLMLMG